MVEITVRHPLSSIIKIATKSSCPEIISFTIGEKLTKSSNNKSIDEPDVANLKIDEDKASSSAAKSDTNSENDYIIRGKEWFFIPDYAGEAASAVKLQILQIMDLTSQ